MPGESNNWTIYLLEICFWNFSLYRQCNENGPISHEWPVASGNFPPPAPEEIELIGWQPQSFSQPSAQCDDRARGPASGWLPKPRAATGATPPSLWGVPWGAVPMASHGPPAVYTACQDSGLMFFGVLGKGMVYGMPVYGPYPCPQLKCKSPNSSWWINQCENHSGSLGLRNLQVTAPPSPLKRSLCCFDFQAALDSSVQITPRKTPQRRSGIGEDLRNAQPLEERLFQLEQRIKNEAGRPLRRAVFFSIRWASQVN